MFYWDIEYVSPSLWLDVLSTKKHACIFHIPGPIPRFSPIQCPNVIINIAIENKNNQQVTGIDYACVRQ
jgi:hypothetical protein